MREGGEKELIFVDYILLSYPMYNVLLYIMHLGNALDVVNTSAVWLSSSSSSPSPCVWHSEYISLHVLQMRTLRLREVKELPNITQLAYGRDRIRSPGSSCVEKTKSRQS